VKRRLARKRRLAVVCAGGGVTGGVYEIGCLRALEDLLDRSLLDFDSYVGVSGGAFVAALLAAGVTPQEMYQGVTGRSPLAAEDGALFRLGLPDLLKSGARAPRVLRRAARALVSREDGSVSDALLSLFELLPAGLLDNSGVRDWLARILERRGVADRFGALPRELHIVAVDLDSGEATAFGGRSHPNVPVSQAVQASTALPGLYRPVRIDGRDYVDGGVKKTAHVNLAIRRGAELVVCLNPMVPILNRGGALLDGKLSQKGVTYVLDQALRIMLHGRMQYGLERYRAEHPEVDILVLEPARADMRMFRYNIMRMSARQSVALYGYRSALSSFRRRRTQLTRLLRRHGISMRDPRSLPDTPEASPYRSEVARALASDLAFLSARLDDRTK
jgi:predicted acylesterase/phospholipase RssA